MSNLFKYDNPIMQMLSRICDLMIVNLMFMICCLPIVTIGASIAALQKVTQDMVFDDEKNAFMRFFQAFRENFKQSTIIWLILLFFLCCMVFNIILIITYTSGNTVTALCTFILIFVAIVLAIASYMFPLIARYENTLRQHFKNSVILSLWKLPRTVAMVILNSSFFLIMYFSTVMFLESLVFWIVLGFALISYIDSLLLSPVFNKLEEKLDDEQIES